MGTAAPSGALLRELDALVGRSDLEVPAPTPLVRGHGFRATGRRLAYGKCLAFQNIQLDVTNRPVARLRVVAPAADAVDLNDELNSQRTRRYTRTAARERSTQLPRVKASANGDASRPLLMFLTHPPGDFAPLVEECTTTVDPPA